MALTVAVREAEAGHSVPEALIDGPSEACLEEGPSVCSRGYIPL